MKKSICNLSDMLSTSEYFNNYLSVLVSAYAGHLYRPFALHHYMCIFLCITQLTLPCLLCELPYTNGKVRMQ